MRPLALIVLAILAGLASALADAKGGGLDLSVVQDMPPSAESGKPAIGSPTDQRDAGSRIGCPPALPCDTRLIGTVRKNGAVELQVPAWHW